MLFLGFQITLPTLFLAAVVSAMLFAVVLFILFPDRAAFTPKIPGVPMAPGALPVVGHLIILPTWGLRACSIQWSTR
jgi:hypothetical protein